MHVWRPVVLTVAAIAAVPIVAIVAGARGSRLAGRRRGTGRARTRAGAAELLGVDAGQPGIVLVVDHVQQRDFAVAVHHVLHLAPTVDKSRANETGIGILLHGDVAMVRMDL